MVLVRPFRNKEAALRPYLRYYQWSQIWGSQEAPTEAILPDLQQRAIEEAKGLELICSEMLRTKLECLPEKERTGRSPGQWRVVKFATLAKKADLKDQLAFAMLCTRRGLYGLHDF